MIRNNNQHVHVLLLPSHEPLVLLNKDGSVVGLSPPRGSIPTAWRYGR